MGCIFLLIKSFKICKKSIIIIIISIIFVVLLSSIIVYYSFANSPKNIQAESQEETNEAKKAETTDSIKKAEEAETQKNFIKWVDFNVTSEALNLTAKMDIDSHNNNEEIVYNWIELLAYLSCKNGGNFKNFKSKDLQPLIQELKNGQTMEELTQNMKFYDYYYESYTAVLGGFIGNYSVEVAKDEEGTKTFEDKYGLKAFLPIAKNYSFSHYDDFGNSRSYGFKRTHLGNDLMGSIGTPIIAVESGVVENLGWNQYGGWRIGIRSFDTKRYY